MAGYFQSMSFLKASMATRHETKHDKTVIGFTGLCYNRGFFIDDFLHDNFFGLCHCGRACGGGGSKGTLYGSIDLLARESFRNVS